MHKKTSGFTLIELMVVIAIIALLSVVVTAAVSSQRGRARVASVQKTLSSVKAVANTCMSGQTILNSPSTPGTTLICAGAPAWPILPTAGTWTYATTGSTDCHNGGATLDLTTADGSFRFCAWSATANDNKAIVCDEQKCTAVTYVGVAP